MKITKTLTEDMKENVFDNLKYYIENGKVHRLYTLRDKKENADLDKVNEEGFHYFISSEDYELKDKNLMNVYDLDACFWSICREAGLYYQDLIHYLENNRGMRFSFDHTLGGYDLYTSKWDEKTESYTGELELTDKGESREFLIERLIDSRWLDIGDLKDILGKRLAVMPVCEGEYGIIADDFGDEEGYIWKVLRNTSEYDETMRNLEDFLYRTDCYLQDEIYMFVDDIYDEDKDEWIQKFTSIGNIMDKHELDWRINHCDKVKFYITPEAALHQELPLKEQTHTNHSKYTDEQIIYMMEVMTDRHWDVSFCPDDGSFALEDTFDSDTGFIGECEAEDILSYLMEMYLTCNNDRCKELYGVLSPVVKYFDKENEKEQKQRQEMKQTDSEQ